jgi:vacuolar-type H+-ATPase subunit C/Vma6
MSVSGYLLGRVRSREARLLTAADYAKYDYAAAATFEELEQKLHYELDELRRDLFWNTDIAELFWKKYDNHNLKILLKEKLTGQDLSAYLLRLGKNTLAEFDRALIEQAAELYARTADFGQMDYFLDQKYFAELKKLAAKFSLPVRRYAQALADIADYKRAFTPENAAETLRAKFPGLKLPEELNEGAVEKALDDYAAGLLFAGRYAFDAAAVFCYLLAKENEIKNLKTMYLSRAKGLAGLTAYLRRSYV